MMRHEETCNGFGNNDITLFLYDPVLDICDVYEALNVDWLETKDGDLCAGKYYSTHHAPQFHAEGSTLSIASSTSTTNTAGYGWAHRIGLSSAEGLNVLHQFWSQPLSEELQESRRDCIELAASELVHWFKDNMNPVDRIPYLTSDFKQKADALPPRPNV
eukprot:PhF_6_TR15642/c0_g1_i4/m.24291